MGANANRWSWKTSLRKRYLRWEVRLGKGQEHKGKKKSRCKGPEQRPQSATGSRLNAEAETRSEWSIKQRSLYIEDSTTRNNWTALLKYDFRKTLCLFSNVGRQNSHNWTLSWRWIIRCFGEFNAFKIKINRLCFEVMLTIQMPTVSDIFSFQRAEMYMPDSCCFFWDWVLPQSCRIKNCVKISA